MSENTSHNTRSQLDEMFAIILDPNRESYNDRQLMGRIKPDVFALTNVEGYLRAGGYHVERIRANLNNPIIRDFMDSMERSYSVMQKMVKGIAADIIFDGNDNVAGYTMRENPDDINQMYLGTVFADTRPTDDDLLRL